MNNSNITSMLQECMNRVDKAEHYLTTLIHSLVSEKIEHRIDWKIQEYFRDEIVNTQDEHIKELKSRDWIESIKAKIIDEIKPENFLREVSANNRKAVGQMQLISAQLNVRIDKLEQDLLDTINALKSYIEKGKNNG